MLRDRLTTVLGASAALGEHLARHPADWRLLTVDVPVAPSPVSELRAELLAAVGADPGGREPEASAADGDPATRLRVGYRRRLLRLAAGDLTGEVPLDAVMAGLADLTVAALDAALAIARADLRASASGGRHRPGHGCRGPGCRELGRSGSQSSRWASAAGAS